MIEKVLKGKNIKQAIRQTTSNKGAFGVDKMPVSKLKEYFENHQDKLFTNIINHRYIPSPIRGVEIPKPNGKTRLLGVPTVVDRTLQQAVSQAIMPLFELDFHENSYGFRPQKNAQQAVLQAQKFIEEGYKKIVEIDLKSFFDEVDHSLLLQLIYRKVKCPTTLRLIRLWLRAPILINGKLTKRRKGTPQGSPLSPLLSNLYLHYCIDKWLSIRYPKVKMVRYADDMIVHCETEIEAIALLEQITIRMKECHLTVHPEKTKIVYCKKDGRKLEGHSVQFDFLGFSFQPMITRLKLGGVFLQYDCKMSRKSKKRILQEIRDMELHKKSQSTLQDLAIRLNPKIRGWINYYGKVKRKSLKPVFYYLHHRLIKWILNTYKRFKRSRVLAVKWLRGVTKDYPNLFYHWSLGYQLT
jgi:RNA-directed DNA polymerase